jgi:hypothetical protein
MKITPEIKAHYSAMGKKSWKKRKGNLPKDFFSTIAKKKWADKKLSTGAK